MVTKKEKEAIEYATQFGWTAADAQRAFTNLDFKEADEQVLLRELVKFAGSELLKGQQLQAAQKGQVTKKNKYIKAVELEYAEKLEESDRNFCSSSFSLRC